MNELQDILSKLEADILEIVGDEFAPKQKDGSKERQRLLGLAGKTTIATIDAEKKIRDMFIVLIERSRNTGAPLHSLTKWIKTDE